jgi:hypothetical protein
VNSTSQATSPATLRTTLHTPTTTGPATSAATTCTFQPGNWGQTPSPGSSTNSGGTALETVSTTRVTGRNLLGPLHGVAMGVLVGVVAVILWYATRKHERPPP